jgi:hypothetical protein
VKFFLLVCHPARTGASGVKLWISCPDEKEYAKEQIAGAVDRPFLVDGKIVPWCYGRFQQTQEKLAFR